MDEAYPSRREVYKEIFSRTKDKLLNFGESVKEAGISTVAATSLIALMPYRIPTIVRDFREYDASGRLENGIWKKASSEKIGASLGIVLGLSSWALQAAGYQYLCNHGHSEALALPLATNVISGVYELGRRHYKKVRNQLIEERKRTPNS